MNEAASVINILKSAPKKKQRGPLCHTCQWLSTLDPEEAEAVQKAIYSGEWQMTALSEALRPAGYTAAHGGLANHRRQKH